MSKSRVSLTKPFTVYSLLIPTLMIFVVMGMMVITRRNTRELVNVSNKQKKADAASILIQTKEIEGLFSNGDAITQEGKLYINPRDCN